MIEQAAASYDAETHQETFNYVFNYLQTGQVTGSTGMFDTVDSPTGANHLVRAAGTLLGHLGFPTHHRTQPAVGILRPGHGQAAGGFDQPADEPFVNAPDGYDPPAR